MSYDPRGSHGYRDGDEEICKHLNHIDWLRAYIKTIEVRSDALTNEVVKMLIPIVDDRISFILRNIHLHPESLGKELKCLQDFFKKLEQIQQSVI